MTKALVDSGANSNYISHQLYQALSQVNPQLKFEKIIQQVVIGDKSSIESLGKVHLIIRDDEHTFQAPFHVLPSMTFDMILGMNFLKRNGAIIDVADHSIHFNPVKLP